MEEDRHSGVDVTVSPIGRAESDLIRQIHRELAGLDMPCDCKNELDRTIVAIEVWQRLKARRELVGSIREDYGHLASGVSFLTDLGDINRQSLTPQEMRDHAESLKFLADLADRCARRLNELARITRQDD